MRRIITVFSMRPYGELHTTDRDAALKHPDPFPEPDVMLRLLVDTEERKTVVLKNAYTGELVDGWDD